MMTSKYTSQIGLFSIVTLIAISGCSPTMGGGGTMMSGAAGGSTSVGANENLPRCDSPLGTLAIEEKIDPSWYQDYSNNASATSITPSLQMIIQQSNCFQVVNRSANSLNARSQERNFAESGEARAGSNMGKGQLKVADYSLAVNVLYSNSSVGKAIGAIGGMFGGSALGGLAGGLDQKHTSVNLNLTDVRSTQQVSASEGSSSTTDIGAGVGALGGMFGGGAGGFTSTPQGKALAAAFLDAYSKMVVALKNYNPQTDASGLSGRGGHLGVD